MDVNLRSAYFLSTYAAQAMKTANIKGSIIHISSQMGHIGGIDRTVYCTSKHALEGMVKAMAIEWGELGIRINTICPTFIRTPLTDATLNDPERAAWINEKIKLGRVGEVEDIMGARIILGFQRFINGDRNPPSCGRGMDGWLIASHLFRLPNVLASASQQ